METNYSIHHFHVQSQQKKNTRTTSNIKISKINNKDTRMMCGASIDNFEDILHFINIHEFEQINAGWA